MREPNGELQAWLRTIVVAVTIAGSVLTAAMRLENRITTLEVGQNEVSKRLDRVEEQLRNLPHRR